MKPGDEISAAFEARVVPRKDLVILKPEMLLERDGKRYAVADGVETELGAHLTVILEGAPIEESQMDIVVICQVALIKKSILLPGGRVGVAKVALGEVARIPLVEFLSRADNVVRESNSPA